MDPVAGYLAGMDDYHWLVITSDLKLHLIHKSISRVDLGALDQSGQLEQEQSKEEIEKLVGPFRSYLQKNNWIPQSSGGE